MALYFSGTAVNLSSLMAPLNLWTSKRIFVEALLTSWLEWLRDGRMALKISEALRGPRFFALTPNEFTNL